MRHLKLRYVSYALAIVIIPGSFVYLAKLLEVKARKRVLRDLSSQDQIVRTIAIERCAKLADREAIAKLVKLLQSEDDYTASAAGLALKEIGKPALPMLIDFLEDESLKGRQYAIWPMEHIKDQRVGPLLIARLKDQDPEVRARAAHALGKIRYKRAIGPLTSCLSDDDVAVRCYAAYALGNFRDSQVLKALTGLLDNNDKKVRIAGIKALSNSDDRSVIGHLKECLSDDDPNIRVAAIEALRKKQWPEKIDVLSKELRDDVVAVRLAAASSLSSISPREISDSGVQKRLEDEFIKLLDCEDPRFIIKGALGLGRIKSKRATAPLLRTLNHPNANVRRVVVRALGRASGKFILPSIRRFLHDEDPAVRREAVIAIAQLGSQEDIQLLMTMLNVENDDSVKDSLQWAIAVMKRQEGSREDWQKN